MLVVVVALIAATVAAGLIMRADQQMDRGAQAERLLEEIGENEHELYDVSRALLRGDAQRDDIRRLDVDGALLVAQIGSLDADLRDILEAVPPADRLYRQHVNVELSRVKDPARVLVIDDDEDVRIHTKRHSGIRPGHGR